MLWFESHSDLVWILWITLWILIEFDSEFELFQFSLNLIQFFCIVFRINSGNSLALSLPLYDLLLFFSLSLSHSLSLPLYLFSLSLSLSLTGYIILGSRRDARRRTEPARITGPIPSGQRETGCGRVPEVGWRIRTIAPTEGRPRITGSHLCTPVCQPSPNGQWYVSNHTDR